MKITDYLIMPKDDLFAMYGGKSPYYYRKGSIPVLLVAHVDTVWTREPTRAEIIDDGEIIRSNRTEGIGADDRVGIYIVNKILKEIDCSLLITDGEERGGIGARAFIDDEHDLGVINCIVEFDRRGSNDAVFYDCNNQFFINDVCREFWQLQHGSFSDISVIAPALDWAAVNLSCGYYNEHTQQEYVNIKEVDRIIEEGKKLISNYLGGGTRWIYSDDYFDDFDDELSDEEESEESRMEMAKYVRENHLFYDAVIECKNQNEL
ncbi:MAG: hypothetical protein LBH59_09845 [Planctomycetaceae bacterium]|jgi:hypothetical protein|nr:hypothetical protein [Planctomycetaceae bacterium]